MVVSAFNDIDFIKADLHDIRAVFGAIEMSIEICFKEKLKLYTRINFATDFHTIMEGYTDAVTDDGSYKYTVLAHNFLENKTQYLSSDEKKSIEYIISKMEQKERLP